LAWNDVLAAVLVEDWLWELVDGLIVQWVVLLSIGGLVPGLVSPGIFWSGPGAVRLDGNVVGASADSEETLLTPMVSPRVSHEPIWLVTVDTISNDRDVVNDFEISGLVAEDATGVLLKSIWDGDTTSDWTALVDLLHHVLLARDFSVLFGLVDAVLWWDVASLAWVTVSAS
jgi:hypothetical protein